MNEVDELQDGEGAAAISGHREVEHAPMFTRRDLVVWGVSIELATLLVAIGLAYLSGQHFWRGIRFSWSDAAIGCAAVGPMLLVFVLARDLREIVRRLLGPAMAEASLFQLALIALLAGVCEEALFRGVLEPWWTGSHWLIGFVGTSLLFGMLHAVSWSYFAIATLFGAYLSLITWGIGEPNLLRAIVCHALYDFVAFLWLARLQRKTTQERSIS